MMELSDFKAVIKLCKDTIPMLLISMASYGRLAMEREKKNDSLAVEMFISSS